MTKTPEKFHALQLFTDTFTAETVHLTNEAIGIYIRLICFNWTKNTKPFTAQDAYRICYCKSKQCEQIVQLVLDEFFIKTNGKYTQKRLIEEHTYLKTKYQLRSEAGRKGGLAKSNNATSKIVAPTPTPIPIPKKLNKMEENGIQLGFLVFWDSLTYKKGSKKLAWQRYLKECPMAEPEILAKKYNKYASTVQDKQFLAHVSTWISQRRFEDEENNKPLEIKEPDVFYKDQKLKKVGEFGQYVEYQDLKGNKYQKHKWKDEGVVPIQ